MNKIIDTEYGKLEISRIGMLKPLNSELFNIEKKTYVFYRELPLWFEFNTIENFEVLIDKNIDIVEFKDGKYICSCYGSFEEHNGNNLKPYIYKWVKENKEELAKEYKLHTDNLLKLLKQMKSQREREIKRIEEFRIDTLDYIKE